MQRKAAALAALALPEWGEVHYLGDEHDALRRLYPKYADQIAARIDYRAEVYPQRDFDLVAFLEVLTRRLAPLVEKRPGDILVALRLPLSSELEVVGYTQIVALLLPEPLQSEARRIKIWVAGEKPADHEAAKEHFRKVLGGRGMSEAGLAGIAAGLADPSDND